MLINLFAFYDWSFHENQLWQYSLGALSVSCVLKVESKAESLRLTQRLLL